MPIKCQKVPVGLFLVLGASVSFLGGCGSSGSAGGERPAASSGACAALRSDLTQMERRGLPALAESQNNGKKLSKKQRADVRAYNKVLNDYLGSRCHT